MTKFSLQFIFFMKRSYFAMVRQKNPDASTPSAHYQRAANAVKPLRLRRL